MNQKAWLAIVAVAVSVALVACGGGGGGGGGAAPPPPVGDSPPPPPPAPTGPVAVNVAPGTNPPPTIGEAPKARAVAANRAEAARFLVQATFGANKASIDELMDPDGFNGNFEAWIDAELAKAPPSPSFYDYVATGGATGQPEATVFGLFWRHATYGEAQLRQRMAFALSQIFVTSADRDFFPDAYRDSAAASYYNMLTDNAFGRYRDVLEDVSLHPYMGLYLGTLKNRKESEDGKIIPDQNYAREVMQLFSIGLHVLNPDGTAKAGPGSSPIPTYNNEDIAGLSRVFTGWSWDLNNFTDDCGQRGDSLCNNKPMKPFPAFHSSLEKKFLGHTVTATDPRRSLKEALDHIAGHSNVAPFISRRLIQQFVTSNPTRDYVGRVAQVFEASDGDLGKVVKAVLLDPEARDVAYAERTPGYGKLREPVIRLANWMRAFELFVPAGGTPLNPDVIGQFEIANKRSELCQYPMSAPSVFNFWRPGFVPNTVFAQSNDGNGLVAPEMQVVHEVCVATYLQMMRSVIGGTRNNDASNLDFGLTNENGAVLIHSLYNRIRDMSSAGMVAILNEELAAGRMPSDLREVISRAVDKVPATTTTERLRRARIAVMLTMASPEYLVQK